MKTKFFHLYSALIMTICLTSHASLNKSQDEPHHPRSAFLAKKNGVILEEKGNCDKRHAPYSTFKVVLALMGFDAGILKSKDSPKWSFKEEYEQNFQSWYTRDKGFEYGWCQDHTPKTFMMKSVLWFSHQITQALGAEKFENYVMKLHYGNQDISGTPGMNDALLNSWLGTSLKISVREQVDLLEKLLAGNLDVSKETQEKTREVMDREEEWNGWKLYGKTGGGSGSNGWFVGWIEKEGQAIVFAHYLDLTDPALDLTGITQQKTVGLTAKELIKRELQDYL